MSALNKNIIMDIRCVQSVTVNTLNLLILLLLMLNTVTIVLTIKNEVGNVILSNKTTKNFVSQFVLYLYDLRGTKKCIRFPNIGHLDDINENMFTYLIFTIY